jgi:hypothetical protein
MGNPVVLVVSEAWENWGGWSSSVGASARSSLQAASSTASSAAVNGLALHMSVLLD